MSTFQYSCSGDYGGSHTNPYGNERKHRRDARARNSTTALSGTNDDIQKTERHFSGEYGK